MSTAASPMPGSLESRNNLTAPFSHARLFYWSLRRELWEYRSIYLAPLVAAAIALFGLLISLAGLPGKMRTLPALHAAQQSDTLAQPFAFAAYLIMGAAFLVTIFYSLDALYGERRDRSILFWKSLPVSDLTTVLTKAAIPLVVLPVVAFAVTVVTEAIMLLFSSVVVLASRMSVADLWTRLQLPQTAFMLLYHLVTMHMLWYAPFYAWFLLVSAWARRAPILWAILPPFAIGIFEKIAFHTSYFAMFLLDRFGGGEAVDNMRGNDVLDPGIHLAPWQFLSAPGLWLGLAVAAGFLAAAVRLRRFRGPV